VQEIPGRTAREGFGRLLVDATLPPSQAAVANVRLLKKRAAHSHLSSADPP